MSFNRNIVFLISAFQLLLFSFSHAQKNLDKGNRLFDLNMFEEAMVYFQKEIDANKSKEAKAESMQQLANCYRMLGRFEEAEEMYRNIFRTKKRDPKNVLNYAHALKSSSKYAEALEEYTQYALLNPDDPMGEIYIESCRLAQQWLDEPLKNEVRNFMPANSSSPDFAPAFYEKGLVFCSSREGSKRKFISVNGKNEETLLDFYMADISSEAPNAVPFHVLNSYLHEGPASFSGDGRSVYFTRTMEGRKDKKKNRILSTLQIFYSEKDSTGNWSEPVSAFPFNSVEYSVGQPSLSPDGKSLYFMSDMPGGSGGTDIYVVYRDGKGEWGAPENLGKTVNTFGFELFPFISSDNVLYFSSNTHPGMGKLDVFSVKKMNGQWVNLSNLKPPVNSIADDFALVVEDGSKRGFFSSNRFNGAGYDDIYSFIQLQPIRLSFDGNMLHIEDQGLFDAVKYKLVNSNNEEQPFNLEKNTYAFRLAGDTDYVLVARKEGFSYNKIKLKMVPDPKEEELRIEVSPSLKPVTIHGVLREYSEASKSDSLKTIYQNSAIADATASLNKNNARIERTKTSVQGEYSFTSTLDAGGEYAVVFKGGTISRPGQEKAEAVVTMKKDSTGPSMENSATPVSSNAKIQLAGQIKSQGASLGNTLVLLLKDGDVVDEIITDKAGKYMFEAVPDASYTIVASKAGYFDNYINISPGEMNEEKKERELILLKKEMITIKGMAKDEEGAPMINSPVTLSRGTTVLARRITNEKGEFEFLALKDGDYSITITQKGYMQKDIPVSTIGEKVENPIILDTKIEKISTLAKEQTLNIYYDYNSADLRAESIPALNKLIDFLKQNPAMKIEISAHTDSRGSDEYNLTLSQKRAESVVLYLYFDGEISKERMSAKGYGETKLVNHCKNGVTCSEEEHGVNRRTELKVLSYQDNLN